MNSSELSSYFASASPTLNRLKSLADSLEQSILELCVGYVKEIPWASGLIFGVFLFFFFSRCTSNSLAD